MTASPLVILHFDAAEPELIEAWMAEGRLPTLALVVKRGCYGRLTDRRTICEHGIRLSLYSGITCAQHGHYWFRQLVPRTYDLRPVTVEEMDVQPFWACLSGTGLRCLIVDVPETRLVEGLEGTQVGNWSVIQADRCLRPPSTRPVGLLREVRKVAGPFTRFREYYTHQDPEQDIALRDRLLARLARQGGLCRHLLERGPFDLIVAGFHEAHVAGHQFWKYRNGDAQDNGLSRAMRQVYEATDRELGLLLERLPPTAHVFILSAFGMRGGFPAGDLMDAFCVNLGYHRLHRGHDGGGSARASRRMPDYLPERLRSALSQRIPRAAQEFLLRRRLRRGTDWSRTEVFAIPSLFTGMLRINLRGREPAGIVNEGREYTALLDRLESDLLQLRDEDGLPAIAGMVRTADVYGGGPPEKIPDLVVHWAPWPTLRTRVQHPRALLTQPVPAYYRDTYHSTTGFLTAAGPLIQPCGERLVFSPLDLAPTFLRMLKRTPLPDMPGTPIDRFARS